MRNQRGAKRFITMMTFKYLAREALQSVSYENSKSQQVARHHTATGYG
jgi:hypothetical protein